MLQLEKKILIFKNLYDTYNAMNLPVSQIESGNDFTIHNIKDLHPELPLSHSDTGQIIFLFYL